MRRRLSGVKIQDDDFDTFRCFRLQPYAILTIEAVVNCQLRLVPWRRLVDFLKFRLTAKFYIVFYCTGLCGPHCNELHVTVVYKMAFDMYKAVETILFLVLFFHFRGCVHAQVGHIIIFQVSDSFNLKCFLSGCQNRTARLRGLHFKIIWNNTTMACFNYYFLSWIITMS